MSDPQASEHEATTPPIPRAAHVRHTALKFFLLLAVLVGYFLYLTYEYDLMTGGIVALISWSFFVLCTPVADAGFLLDFPIRMLFGVRMFVSELLVWALAILVNVAAIVFTPGSYETTALTQIFYTILTQPYPYWAVIFISMVGTFLSIKFGDEMLDSFHHKDRLYFIKHHPKYELILIIFGFVVCFIAYAKLIDYLDLSALLG